MSSPPPSPLADPNAWNLVSPGYAEIVQPMLTFFSEDALARAKVTEDTRVADVATGPGTLALLAAKLGARVSALDFAEDMVTRLRATIARDSIDGLDAVVGNGMALPWDSETFDAAFSMFGLMFFPDRGRGFRELKRVLAPGGVAVVTSWVPMTRVPLMAAMFDAVREMLPSLPFGSDAKAPLSERADFEGEMRGAGFSDVEVHEVAHRREVGTTADFWAASERSTAPVMLLSKKLGGDWPKVSEGVLSKLRSKLGDGPHTLDLIANVGIGRA